MNNTTVTLLVGAAVALGGFMGYARKGSVPSLVAGGASGGLMMLSSYLMNSSPATGYPLALAVSGLLTVMMGSRVAKGAKFMPAGLVATLSGVAFAFNCYVYFNK